MRKTYFIGLLLAILVALASASYQNYNLQDGLSESSRRLLDAQDGDEETIETSEESDEIETEQEDEAAEEVSEESTVEDGDEKTEGEEESEEKEEAIKEESQEEDKSEESAEEGIEEVTEEESEEEDKPEEAAEEGTEEESEEEKKSEETAEEGTEEATKEESEEEDKPGESTEEGTEEEDKPEEAAEEGSTEEVTKEESEEKDKPEEGTEEVTKEESEEEKKSEETAEATKEESEEEKKPEEAAEEGSTEEVTKEESQEEDKPEEGTAEEATKEESQEEDKIEETAEEATKEESEEENKPEEAEETAEEVTEEESEENDKSEEAEEATKEEETTTIDCGTCAGATPLCNADSTACVACNDDTAAGSCPDDYTCNSNSGRCDFDCRTCSGDTPVCNNDSTACVACTEDDDCNDNYKCNMNNMCIFDCDSCDGNTPLCDFDAGACVACDNNDADTECPLYTGCTAGTGSCDWGCEHCGGFAPLCNTGNETCLPCTDEANADSGCPAAHTCNNLIGTCDFDCSSCTGATPLCDFDAGQCVGCSADSADTKCPRLFDCNAQSGECEFDCDSCIGRTPFCDAEGNACVACNDNVALTTCSGNETCQANGACEFDCATCSGNTPFCNANRDGCVSCSMPSADSCPGENPFCLASGACGKCSDDGAVCPNHAPVCQAGGTCGRCNIGNSGTLCTGGTPVCNLVTGACVANPSCNNNTDCAFLFNGTDLITTCGSESNTCQANQDACNASNVATVCNDNASPICNRMTGECKANTCNVNSDCEVMVDDDNATTFEKCNGGQCTAACTQANSIDLCGENNFCNTETGNCTPFPRCFGNSDCDKFKRGTGDEQVNTCELGSCLVGPTMCNGLGDNTPCENGEICKFGICSANTCETSLGCIGVVDDNTALTICSNGTCVEEVACDETADCNGVRNSFRIDLTACVNDVCGIPQGPACSSQTPCDEDSEKPYCKDSFCAPCEGDDSCPGQKVCDSVKGYCYVPIDVSADIELLSDEASAAEVSSAVTAIADAIPDDAPVSSAALEAIENASAGLASFAGAATTPEKASAAIDSIKSLSAKTEFATPESLNNLAAATFAVASSALGSSTVTLDESAAGNLADSLSNIVTSATGVFSDDAGVKETQLKQVSAALGSVMSAAGKESSADVPTKLESDSFKGAVARDTAENLSGKTTCTGDNDSGAGCVDVANDVASKLEGCDGSIEFLVLAKEFNEAGSAAAEGSDVSDKTQEMSFFCIAEDGSRTPITVDSLPQGAEITFTLTAGENKFLTVDSCQFWDEEKEEWSSEGVTGVLADDAKSIVCRSQHLTNFTTFDNGVEPVVEEEVAQEEAKTEEDVDDEDEEETEEPNDGCDDNSDCSGYKPYCNTSKQCVACNSEEDNKICKEINAAKPMCQPEGHCTKDLSQQVTQAKNFLDSLDDNDEVDVNGALDTIDDLIGESLTDLPSTQSKEIVESLTSALDTVASSVNSVGDFGSFADSLKTLSEKADHYTAASTSSVLDATVSLLSDTTAFASNISDEMTKNISDSLSNTVKAVNDTTNNNTTKSTNFGKIDTSVRSITALFRGALDDQTTVKKINTDNIKAVVASKPKDNVGTLCQNNDGDNIATGNNCVTFPSAVSGKLSACGTNVHAESITSDYNTNATANSVAKKMEISLFCDNNSTAVAVRNLSETIDFTPVMPDTTPSDPLRCVYWNESDSEWSTEGCETVTAADNSITCKCDHLTTFSLETYDDSESNNDDGDDDDDTNFVVALIIVLVLLVGLAAAIFYHTSKKAPAKNQAETAGYHTVGGTRV